MQEVIIKAVVIYVVLINIIAVIATVADKKRARLHKWRIPESTLLTISALGGSPAMLITMKKIRHKTQHAKFMIGIPVIMALQALLIGGVLFLFLK